MCPHPHVPSGKTEFGTSGRAGWSSSCRHFLTGKGLTQLANPLSKAEQGEPVFHFKIAPDEISQGICSLCNLRESKALLLCPSVPDLCSSPVSSGAAGAGGSRGLSPAVCLWREQARGFVESRILLQETCS